MVSANPLKFEYSFWFDPSTGVAVYRAVLEQEGPFADKEYLYTNSMSGLQPTQSVTNQGAVSTTRSTKAVAPSKVSVGPVKLDTWSRQNPNATVIAQNRSYAIPAGANPVVNNYWTYAQPAAQQLGRVEMYNGKLLYPTLDETTKKSTISRWNSYSKNQPDNDWQDVPGALNQASEGEQFASAIRARNSCIAEMNRRINSVLESVTGETVKNVKQPVKADAPDPDETTAIPDSAVAAAPSTSTAPPSIADFWWNWWLQYNEAYTARRNRRNRWHRPRPMPTPTRLVPAQPVRRPRPPNPTRSISPGLPDGSRASPPARAS